MSLDIRTEQPNPQCAKLFLDGALNGETHALLDLELAALPDVVNTVILDMAALKFISSAGLRVVFAAVKRLHAQGGKLGICNMQPGVKKVFEIARALPDLQVFSDDEEMDAYLAGFQTDRD